MKKVDRHTIDIDKQRILRSKPLLPIILKGVASGFVDKLEDLLLHASDAAACELVIDGVTEEAKRNIFVAAAAGGALFRAFEQPKEAFTVRFFEAPFLINRIPNKDIAGPTDWINAYYFAIVARDAEALDALVATKDTSLRSPGIQADRFVFTWVATLQAFERNDPAFGSLLIRSLTETDPSGLKIASPAWTLNVVVPVMELLSKLASDDEAGFHEALFKAVSLHKKYWSAASRADDPDGFIALGPLALACLANDRGWRLQLESPYVPRALVER